MVDKGGTAVDDDVALGDLEAGPPLDQRAVEHAYRWHRARRRARVKHHRETRRAGLRFWLVLVLLLAAGIALTVLIVQEIQHLFGV